MTPSVGSFPVANVTFVLLLVGTIMIVAALNFFPAMSLGPIVEHFLLQRGQLFSLAVPVLTGTPWL